MPSYKKEAEKLRTENELKRQANQFLESRVKKLEAEKLRCEEEKKKGFSCVVYCSNCQRVGSVLVPRSGSVKMSGCAWCGASGFGNLVAEVMGVLR